MQDVVPTVEIRIIRVDDGLPFPTRQHSHDAGYDLYARCDLTIAPGGGRAIVPTGITIAMPVGYAGFVHPRSGLAMRNGVTVLNAPGIIDAGYRGEVMVCLINTDPRTTFEVRRGDRVAQLVVQQVAEVRWAEVSALPKTSRGSRGFGSTGIGTGGTENE